VTAATPTPAEVRRREVLTTAAETFSKRGFRAASMHEIATAIGLSKPTLYHYFRSKEELLVRLYSDVLDESLAMARDTVAAAGSPLDAVRDLIASRVAYTCRHQALLKVCFEEEHELPEELAGQVLRRRHAFEDLFHDALARHLAAHPHLPAEITPTVYVNMCLGAVNWCYKWYRPDGPASPEHLGRQIATSLTTPLEPAPPRG
jgi:AcrR family transcriptional regulator